MGKIVEKVMSVKYPPKIRTLNTRREKIDAMEEWNRIGEEAYEKKKAKKERLRNIVDTAIAMGYCK